MQSQERQERTLRTKLEFYDFEMFSKKGNMACRRMVTKIFNKIEGPYRLCEQAIINQIQEGIEKIEKDHPEVRDSEPRHHIATLVTQMCDKIGYKYQINRWDF